MKPSPQRTHGQILKSSALIGSSSVCNIGLGIIRTKALALLLGPGGFGLLGLFNSIADLARTVSEMGINSSGVRQIAESVGTGDESRVARTMATVRRVSYALGFLGAVLLAIFAVPVARVSFGDASRAGEVALLAAAVFLGAIHSAQAALVQGVRRIGDLARLNVLGALLGTVLCIPVVWFLGERGTVPALICIAGSSAAVSWWYSRKILTNRASFAFEQLVTEAKSLLKLGAAFMTAGMMTLGVAYLVRIMIVHRLNTEAAGLYQAAWTLAGLYITFILQAMGADFFPRLTTVANDNASMNRLVNEQAEVSLLLAGPGIAATLTFAPVVIHLLYSASFEPAVELLRWMCLGMLLRVCSWPLGFVLLARGERMLFFLTEMSTHLLHVGFVWLGLREGGLRGVGMAFFAVYVFYWTAVFLVVRRLSGFRMSAANLKTTLILLPLVGVVFVSNYLLPPMASLAVGTIISISGGLYALRTMCHLVSLGRMPRAAHKLLSMLRLAPPRIEGEAA